MKLIFIRGVLDHPQDTHSINLIGHGPTHGSSPIPEIVLCGVFIRVLVKAILSDAPYGLLKLYVLFKILVAQLGSILLRLSLPTAGDVLSMFLYSRFGLGRNRSFLSGRLHHVFHLRSYGIGSLRGQYLPWLSLNLNVSGLR